MPGKSASLYTDYTLPVNEISSNEGLREAKATILKQLEDDRQMDKHLSMVTRYYFKLPHCTTH